MFIRSGLASNHMVNWKTMLAVSFVTAGLLILGLSTQLTALEAASTPAGKGYVTGDFDNPTAIQPPASADGTSPTDAAPAKTVSSDVSADTGVTVSPASGGQCTPLPMNDNPTVNVSTAEELWQAAVADKTPNRTILLADGTYDLGALADAGRNFWIATPGLTIRSASGNRDAVILNGGYRQKALTIAAPNVTIADLTYQNSRDIGIHVQSNDETDADGATIHNVRIVDPGEHAIKVNPHEQKTNFADNGTVACSHLELTDPGREKVLELNGQCYTGGINVHASRGWNIRDNRIEGFWCTRGLSEHAISLKTGSRDSVVERNRLLNNARGIGVGLYPDVDSHTAGVRTYDDNPCPDAAGTYVEHYGGIIRNNFIFAGSDDLFASEAKHDSGINLWHACEAKVLHNTVFATQEPFSSIEWRWPNTSGTVANNLVSHNLMARDEATVTQSGNVTGAQASWFVDAAQGDLHLLPTATQAIDRADPPQLEDVADDIDQDTRPIGTASDVGADETGGQAPGDETTDASGGAVDDSGVIPDEGVIPADGGTDDGDVIPDGEGTDDGGVIPDDGGVIPDDGGGGFYDDDALFDLGIAKTGPANCQKGTNCTYTITVTNHGPEVFSNSLVVTDRMPENTSFVSVSSAEWACSASGRNVTCYHNGDVTLAPSASISFDITISLPNDLAGNSITNCTAISWGLMHSSDGPGDGNDHACINTPVEEGFDLGIEKTGPAQCLKGGICEFNITVTNHGPGNFSGTLTLTDTLPGNTYSLEGASDGWGCVQSDGNINCTRNGVALAGTGETTSFTMRVRLPADIPNTETEAQNCVQFDWASMGVTDGDTDTNPDSDCHTVQIQHTGYDLEINKAGAPSCANAGALKHCVYTITITNHGPDDATLGPLDPGVQFIDTLPDGATYDSVAGSVPWTCNPTSPTERLCSPAGGLTLTTGQTETVTFTVRHPHMLVGSSKTLHNCVHLNFTGITDDNGDNDHDCADIVLAGDRFNLGVEKTGDDECTRGGICNYHIEIKNSGAADFTGPLVFTDTLPNGIDPASIQPVPGWNCTPTGVGNQIECRTNDDVTLIGNDGTTTLDIRFQVPDVFPPDQMENCVDLTAGNWLEMGHTADEDPGNEHSCHTTNIVDPVADPEVDGNTSCRVGTMCSNAGVVLKNAGNRAYQGPLGVKGRLSSPAVNISKVTGPAGWSCSVDGAKYRCEHADVTLLPAAKQGGGFKKLTLHIPIPADFKHKTITHNMELFWPGSTLQNLRSRIGIGPTNMLRKGKTNKRTDNDQDESLITIYQPVKPPLTCWTGWQKVSADFSKKGWNKRQRQRGKQSIWCAVQKPACREATPSCRRNETRFLLPNKPSKDWLRRKIYQCKKHVGWCAKPQPSGCTEPMPSCKTGFDRYSTQQTPGRRWNQYRLRHCGKRVGWCAKPRPPGCTEPVPSCKTGFDRYSTRQTPRRRWNQYQLRHCGKPIGWCAQEIGCREATPRCHRDETRFLLPNRPSRDWLRRSIYRCKQHVGWCAKRKIPGCSEPVPSCKAGFKPYSSHQTPRRNWDQYQLLHCRKPVGWCAKRKIPGCTEPVPSCKAGFKPYSSHQTPRRRWDQYRLRHCGKPVGWCAKRKIPGCSEPVPSCKAGFKPYSSHQTPRQNWDQYQLRHCGKPIGWCAKEIGCREATPTCRRDETRFLLPNKPSRNWLRKKIYRCKKHVGWCAKRHGPTDPCPNGIQCVGGKKRGKGCTCNNPRRPRRVEINQCTIACKPPLPDPVTCLGGKVVKGKCVCGRYAEPKLVRPNVYQCVGRDPDSSDTTPSACPNGIQCVGGKKRGKSCICNNPKRPRRVQVNQCTIACKPDEPGPRLTCVGPTAKRVGNHCSCGDKRYRLQPAGKNRWQCFLREVKCGTNQIKVGNRCQTCGRNQIKRGNRCVTREVRCGANQIKVGNRCQTCGRNQIKRGNRCVTREVKCGAKQIKVGNRCQTCGRNQIKRGNRCVTREVKCGAKQIKVGNRCQTCGRNQIKRGNRCVTREVRCGANQIKVGNRCQTCGRNQIKRGNRCVTREVKCGAKQIKVGNRCQTCGRNQIKRGNRCVTREVRCGAKQIKVGNRCQTCGRNQIKRGNRCHTCGRNKIKRGNRCVRKP